LNALEDLYDKLHARGKHLILSGPHTQPLFMMDKAGFLDRLGRENVCANIEHSLERSREILGLPPAPVRADTVRNAPPVVELKP
jgi:SulP family sulfate permease